MTITTTARKPGTKKSARNVLLPANSSEKEKTHAHTKVSRVSRHRVIVRPASERIFELVYLLPPNERINEIKKGVSAKRVNDLAECMNITTTVLLETLGLARATITRKVSKEASLSKDESERVLGIESLIGQVVTMVNESGEPDGFDAAKWVSNWLKTPLPALGGKTPASYMDTVEGQKLVSNILATSQSGAYA